MREAQQHVHQHPRGERKGFQVGPAHSLPDAVGRGGRTARVRCGVGRAASAACGIGGATAGATCAPVAAVFGAREELAGFLGSRLRAAAAAAATATAAAAAATIR